MDLKAAYLDYQEQNNKWKLKVTLKVTLSIFSIIIIVVFLAQRGQLFLGIILGLILFVIILYYFFFKPDYEGGNGNMEAYLGNIGHLRLYDTERSHGNVDFAPSWVYKTMVGFPKYYLECEYKQNFKNRTYDRYITTPINQFGESSVINSPGDRYQLEDGIRIIITSPVTNTCDIRFVLEPLYADYVTSTRTVPKEFYERRDRDQPNIVRFIKPGETLEFNFKDCHTGKETNGRRYLCYGVYLQLNKN